MGRVQLEDRPHEPAFAERHRAASARSARASCGGTGARPDGTWRDSVYFSMLEDEWPAAKARLTERLARG